MLPLCSLTRKKWFIFEHFGIYCISGKQTWLDFFPSLHRGFHFYFLHRVLPCLKHSLDPRKRKGSKNSPVQHVFVAQVQWPVSFCSEWLPHRLQMLRSVARDCWSLNPTLEIATIWTHHSSLRRGPCHNVLHQRVSPQKQLAQTLQVLDMIGVNVDTIWLWLT